MVIKVTKNKCEVCNTTKDIVSYGSEDILGYKCRTCLWKEIGMTPPKKTIETHRHCSSCDKMIM